MGQTVEVWRARAVWKNLPLRIPKSNQTFLRGAALRESLMIQWNSRSQICQTTLKTFRCFPDFWIKKIKIIRPRLTLGLTLNISGVLHQSLKSVNPDFTVVNQKSGTNSGKYNNDDANNNVLQDWYGLRCRLGMLNICEEWLLWCRN